MTVTIPQFGESKSSARARDRGFGRFSSGFDYPHYRSLRQANCCCYQPGHPGRGPNLRLTRKVQGKTVSETFSSPPALRKAQPEVASERDRKQPGLNPLNVPRALVVDKQEDPVFLDWPAQGWRHTDSG